MISINIQSKKSTKHLMLAMVLLTTSMYAGGKAVAPLETKVLPVPEDISSWYLGVGLVAAKFYSCGEGCDYEDVTYGAMLRGGYEFNEYFGVEVRGIRTFLDKGPFGGIPLQHLGVYVKSQYPVSEGVNVYGLLGYGYTENLGNGARLGYFDNDHGFSAGLGVEYNLSDKEAHDDSTFDGYAVQGKIWSLFVDYQRLLIKSNVPDMDVISAGFRYRF